MKPMLSLIALGVALPIAVLADSALERVLKNAPDDAALVFALPSIDRFVEGVVAFGKAIGVDELADFDVDQFLEAFDDAGFPAEFLDQIDTAAAFALTLRPDSDGPLCVLVVTDPKVFDAAALETIQSSLREAGQPTLVRLRNGCLIIGDDESDVAAALEAKGELVERFGAATRGLLDEPRVLFYVNVPEWNEVIDEGLQFAESTIQMIMQMAGPQAEAGLEVWKVMFAATRQAARETRIVVAAGVIDADGLRVHDRATFTPDGVVGTYLKNLRKTKGNLLRGLPDDNTAIAFGCEWSLPKGTETLSEKMFRTMLDMSEIQDKLEPEELANALKLVASVYGRLTGYNIAMSVGRDSQGMLVSGMYFSSDPKAVMKDMGGLFECSSKCMGIIAADMAMDLQRTRETIGTVQVDVYQFDSADAMTQQLMVGLYGESPRVFYAPHEGGVLHALGSADDARRRMGAALSGNVPELTANRHIVTAVKELSPDPQIACFADLPNLMELLMGAARASGAPIPNIKFPKTDSAYAAFGVYLKPDSLRAELFIPASAVKTAVKTVKMLSGHKEPS